MELVGHFFGYSIPWQVWSVPAIAGVIAVFLIASRFFGSKNAAIAAAVAAIGIVVKIIDQRGRQKGYQERIKKENSDAQRVVERAERARNDALGADPERLREDDGFKRH